MQSIGSGVCEVRVRCAGEHRVLYVVKFAEAVYVLSAFAKKSTKTPKKELSIADIRFRALIETRKRLSYDRQD